MLYNHILPMDFLFLLVFIFINKGDYIYFKKAKETLNNTGHQETKIFLEKCIVIWTLKTI